MSGQEWITLALGAGALGYLFWRAARRRLTGTCCGARECPAAKAVLERIGPEVRGPRG